MRVIEGPMMIGNVFGFWGVMVPAGKFAVVEDGELSNGGHGPRTVDGKVYRYRSKAERVLREREKFNQ